MQRTKKTESLSTQVKRHVSKEKEVKEEEEFEGNFESVISTGSTLLDLAISGGRIRGGGVPGGIFMEIFGPNSSGKSVLLSEMAGDVLRKGGEVRFDDPETTLNAQFAKIFDLDVKRIKYATPDTVTQVFENIRKWDPKDSGKIHGTFTDSLAALSTELEMEDEEGDKRGQRRAKEFSEGFRKNARILKQKNYLMVGSNQIRDNPDAVNKYSPKFTSTGGFAIGFYASIRLRASNPSKIEKEVSFRGKTIKQAIGVETEFEVFKNKVWTPYRKVPLYILWDYGIDDIRSNLQYIKNFSGETVYTVRDQKLDKSLDKSIKMVEKDSGTIEDLKNEVIDLWEELNQKFDSNRKKIR
jgi:recombination protein RecA